MPKLKINHFGLNQEIEKFIGSKPDGNYSIDEVNYIQQYTGSGGLIKEGAADRGALYEYYTPDLIIRKMWGLAIKYGYNGGAVLEPSCGIGKFLKYVKPGTPVDAYETSAISAKIASITYPSANVLNAALETRFLNQKEGMKGIQKTYDLVIGNPPYGAFTGLYAGMGEKKKTGASEYDHYFMYRGLYVLNSGGLLVFIVPSAFLSNGQKYDPIKRQIAEISTLIDAYRLPGGVFDKTQIETDIIVFKKK